MEQTRCGWVSAESIYVRYHDEEWGVPIRHDDRALFERLCLEGAQAGLSWITILRKRENYRQAFDGFDPERVAAYDEAKVSALMANAGIVRNQLKIRAAITNARCFLEIQAQHGTFADYLWAYVDGKPIQNRWRSLSELPAETDISRAISKDLKRRGFKFVGSTICYAMMQAVGMVNDHTLDCFRHTEVAALADGL
jgi:DNA-3-methyladenine glycosylase I